MITVDTKAYGEIEIDERQRISFPSGLFGFAEYRDFCLLDANQQPFYWLQSMDAREIAFVLINPLLFRPDYASGASAEDLEILGINSDADENLLLFAIVTIPEDQTRMTANLQGPILINRKTREGRQIISYDDRWQVRHVIMEEMQRARGEQC